MEKQERKILTQNRSSTINKRETSYEGLAEKFVNGEDGLQNLIHEDKNQLFRPLTGITEQDIAEIPFLRQVREAIEVWKNLAKTATGKAAYTIRKAIIDLQKDQYIIKQAYRKPTITMHATHTTYYTPLLSEETMRDGVLSYSGVSLCNPKVCSAILCNYSKLKAAGEGNFISDTWYLMEDFDRISYKALQPHPLLLRLTELKIDGLPNKDIQSILLEEFSIRHTPEYISSLWRNKIPKLIADCAVDEFLDCWYLNHEKASYKKCGRCGQIKLALSRYFSRNNTNKDGLYSICKECRRCK